MPLNIVLWVIGAFLAGWAIRRRNRSRPALLSSGLIAESLLIAIALGISLVGGTQPGGASVDLVIALTACAMGVQNATVRKLAMPDLTTTVLTLTLTGLAADPPGPDRRISARRILSVVAMLAGAFVGALVVVHSGPVSGLAMVVALLALIAGWVHRSTPRGSVPPKESATHDPGPAATAAWRALTLEDVDQLLGHSAIVLTSDTLGTSSRPGSGRLRRGGRTRLRRRLSWRWPLHGPSIAADASRQRRTSAGRLPASSSRRR